MSTYKMNCFWSLDPSLRMNLCCNSPFEGVLSFAETWRLIISISFGFLGRFWFSFCSLLNSSGWFLGTASDISVGTLPPRCLQQYYLNATVYDSGWVDHPLYCDGRSVPDLNAEHIRHIQKKLGSSIFPGHYWIFIHYYIHWYHGWNIIHTKFRDNCL